MMAGFGSVPKYEGGGMGRACDACRTAPSAVYCRADAAFLCGGCDARVHGANRVASRHERVWVCEACEVAPAALACRADAAALCVACDAEVHSANPLARRHQRVPILPIPLPATAGTTFLYPTEELHRHNSEEDEAESWLLINTENCDNHGAFFSSDQIDEYLDLVGYNNNACNEIHNQEEQQLHQQQSEGVVPSSLCLETQQLQKQEMEYEVSNSTAGFSYTANSSSHTVSFTSMDASIAPCTRITDIPNAHRFVNSKGQIKLLPCPPLPRMGSQFPMDREAKVLKYREKRRTRKFEKTIRYELRKTYAEMRPRIKGRFAKQSDAELEMEQMFSTPVPSSDGSYGIVPSF
ncbi:zinc finger protein HD1-like [Zingiber officinale]|uniref:CONSTANS-like protein n=1 Tax=Zingiber officinale TaxID=94328 RepID=A0A8J5LGS9_ZINOF|nr:zinc finger protein HD1-like [Zingiber officinale]KAG6514772.1 hypothetical protein ZIOFF_025142 [Zingiber officinale]